MTISSTLRSGITFEQILLTTSPLKPKSANKPRLATLRAAQVPWWIPAKPQPAGCQR